MANIVNILLTNTFEEWRVKDNEIGAALGDIELLNLAGVTGDETVITALNELRTDATNNASRIGAISTLYDGYTNLVEAANNNDSRLNTHRTEIGDFSTIYGPATPTLVIALNDLNTRTNTNDSDIGDMSLYSGSLTNLTAAINEVHNDLVSVADNVGVSITQDFASLYDGSQTSFISAMNNDYARLNTFNNLVGGTQSNGTTIAFAAADLYGSHTSLVSAIQGIEQFPLTNSLWDGTNGLTLIGALNNHEARLDTEEANVDALQGDVGTWSGYNGAEVDITSALNTIYAVHGNIAADFVNASGDTMTGALIANGGLSASTSLTMGVGGSTSITINNQQRVGIGIAPHATYKVDVSGTLNATDIKIGGESLDNRFLEVNPTGGVDEITNNVRFKGNNYVENLFQLGTKIIYDDGVLEFDEVIQDITGTMFSSNSTSGGISSTYDDNTGKVTLAIADDGHNHVASNIDNFSEEVQDVVGGMVTNPNIESGITVTYDDAAGKLNFNVNDPTISLSGAVTGSATMSNLGSITISTASGSNSIPTSAITDLLEYIQDTIGGMVTGNTESGLDVNYNDTSGKLNFVNSLAIYDVNGTQVF
jgi:hypothetical protein